MVKQETAFDNMTVEEAIAKKPIKVKELIHGFYSDMTKFDVEAGTLTKEVTKAGTAAHVFIPGKYIGRTVEIRILKEKTVEGTQKAE